MAPRELVAAGLAKDFENVTDTTGPFAERVEAMRTSPRFFAVLGVAAALGRVLSPGRTSAGCAVVLSDAFWRKWFTCDPRRSAARSSWRDRPHDRRRYATVVPLPSETTEMWIPAQMTGGLLRERRARFFTAVGRLLPGVTLEQAQADLTTVQRRLGEQYPATDKGWGASLAPLKDQQVGGVRRSLWLLFGAVALVLLAACGNVACLMLSEAARREPGSRSASRSGPRAAWSSAKCWPRGSCWD